MMLSGEFLRQKWPQRHNHLVEECVTARRALHVTDVLPELATHPRGDAICRWSPPSHPRLTLVQHMAGPFRRWWFLCPTCRRRCETLYVPPDACADDGRCRQCHGLIYAIQRYGFRHPLRRVLTRRKKRTAQKRIIPLERRIAKASARAMKSIPPAPAGPSLAELRATAERVREHFERQETMRRQQAEALDGLLIAERQRSLDVLRHLATTAPSKRERERAARSLARWERRVSQRDIQMRTK